MVHRFQIKSLNKQVGGNKPDIRLLEIVKEENFAITHFDNLQDPKSLKKETNT